MTRPTIFIAALAAAAATMSFPAFAGEAARVSEVRYSDLNLASTDGPRALTSRIANAARRVCTFEGDKSVSSAMQARSCTKVAIARAMPQVELALAHAGTRVAENSRLTVAAH